MKSFWLLGCLLLCGVVQAKSANDIPEKFIELLGTKDTAKAFDYLFSQLSAASDDAHAAENKRKIEAMRAQMSGFDIGEVKSSDLILDESYGPHYTRQVYLLVLADKVARFEFYLYDAGAQWRLSSFQFDAGNDELNPKLKEDASRPSFRPRGTPPGR
jgi:hypothetical protein